MGNPMNPACLLGYLRAKDGLRSKRSNEEDAHVEKKRQEKEKLTAVALYTHIGRE